jgi:transcriptional regulator with XRE-family HTH domain
MAEETPDTARRLFGQVARHLRKERGLSLRGLAAGAHYDIAWLSRMENGLYLPPAETITEIDTALHAEGLLKDLRTILQEPQRATPLPLVPGGVEDDAVMLDLKTPEGGSIRVRISRRDFNQLIANGSLATVFPTLTGEDAEHLTHALRHPARIDAQTLGYFTRLLNEHYAADKSLGPRHLLPPVLTQIGVLDDLRRHVPSGQADQLLSVLAQYAEMAGWLHQDLGHLDQAMHWSQRAADWADCAGDRQMVAYMRVRQANIACLTNDSAAVIQYAAGALKSPDLEPKLRALASQQQARGHALQGAHDTAAELLATGRQLLEENPTVTRPGAPVYLHYYDTDTLEEQSAVCHRLAGNIDQAAEILERKIASTAPGLTRDRGHLTAKLALTLTYGQRADPAQASRLGLEALTAAHQTGSARIKHELNELDRRLQQRWPRHPATRKLHQACAETL